MSMVTQVRSDDTAAAQIDPSQLLCDKLVDLQLQGKRLMTPSEVICIIENCGRELRQPVGYLPRWFRETWKQANQRLHGSNYGYTDFSIQGLIDGVTRGWK